MAFTRVHPRLTWPVPVRRANHVLGRGVLGAHDLSVLVVTIPTDAEHLEHRVQPSMIEPVPAQDLP